MTIKTTNLSELEVVDGAPAMVQEVRIQNENTSQTRIRPLYTQMMIGTYILF